MIRSLRNWRSVGLAIGLLTLALVLPALRARSQEPDPAADTPEVALGERLFLETRFAQFFAVSSAGNANAILVEGDAVVATTETTDGSLPGPFAGTSVNCRACHLVDEQRGVAGGGNRAYADFARRSPLPAREDGKRVTTRNAPALVNASLGRATFLLHFDGEFPSGRDLVRGTLTGRPFGWLPAEQAAAIAHIAHIVRHDDGTGDLAAAFGGAYRVVLKGTDPSIPDELRLPPAFRIDVDLATDRQILDAIAALMDAYMTSLVFAQQEAGGFGGSPYDVFLRLNHLPRQPRPDESNFAYSLRLQELVSRLAAPRFVTPDDGTQRGLRRRVRLVTPPGRTLDLLDQPFVFGPRELEGLKIFLRQGPMTPVITSSFAEGVGNCVGCHPAPVFTDFFLHNTGVAQDEYDAIHGAGAFMALAIPDLAERNANFDAYLPPSPAHPHALGPFLDVPSAGQPDRTDLGLWNVFANPDLPAPQAVLAQMLCATVPCDLSAVLPRTIAVFKTPGLRTLGMSSPYLHTGAAARLEDVLNLYVKSSALARQHRLRNGSSLMAGIVLRPQDVRALAAFLRALNEDFE